MRRDRGRIGPELKWKVDGLKQNENGKRTDWTRIRMERGRIGPELEWKVEGLKQNENGKRRK